MVRMSDTTYVVAKRPAYCAHCGRYSAPDVSHCAHCGEPFAPVSEDSPITLRLRRSPLILSGDRPSYDCFPPRAVAILQFLPSGVVLALTLDNPAVLGRASGASEEFDQYNLSDLNAVQHGVSRQHCQLRRQDNHLIATDLDTTNGTYLNDRRLAPGEEYIVLHGDKLILGTLHVVVTFSTPDA